MNSDVRKSKNIPLVKINSTGRKYGNISKEESILTLFKELTKREENVLTKYFGMGGKSKTTLLEMGQDFDMIEEDVLQIKNDGIRKFIKLIVSTGILGDKEDSFSDEFLESADSDFLDNFMSKFICSK